MTECEGPLVWFKVVDDGGAVLECAAQGCGYVIATGGFHDAAHVNTALLTEGLA